MELTFRTATMEDFDAFYQACFFEHRFDVGFRAIIKREWRVLMRNPITLTMVVEDKERRPGECIVGIAQAVFVTSQFVHWAKTDMVPWVNAHITRPLPDGSWPLLNPEEVREANSGNGLNVLLTRWGIAHSLSHEEGLRVRAYMNRNSLSFHRGYNLREILVEAIGEDAQQLALNVGFHLRNDYAMFYRDHPSPPPDKRPILMGVTREEALAKEGSFVSYMFTYTPPRFFFKSHEQDMLNWALLGASDKEIADRQGITLEAVKGQWRSIHRRVAEINPNLLPITPEDGVRGTEKRTTLLRYLREHPEELRPISPLHPRGRDRRTGKREG